MKKNNENSDFMSRANFIQKMPLMKINTNYGEWFPINLCAAPFNFPELKFVIKENCSEQVGIYGDKSLCLWRLDDISLFYLQEVCDEPIAVMSKTIFFEL